MRFFIKMQCRENLRAVNCHRVTFSAAGDGTLVLFTSTDTELAKAEPGKVYEVVVKEEE